MSLRAHARPVPIMVRLLLLFTFSSAFTLAAETIEVKLIDGRNGRPIANTCVNIWVGDERKTPLTIPTETDGAARLRLTNSDAEIKTDDSWKGCGDFGVINPVVRYKDLFKVNVGYVVCEPHGTDFSWLEVKKLSTKEVIERGVVTANTCGKPTASPTPGQVIIFVRPLNFWEKLKQ